MRFVKNICLASILTVALCPLWSCNEDKSNLSEAVLASVSNLDFEVTGSSEKIITVYADAEWVTEVPDWVTVTPASGTGTMEVTISVSDNLRDGTPDNPRKKAVVFKGRTLASRAEVLVVQKGDKYRDVKEYTVGEIAALKDETVVSIPDITVLALTTQGFVVTDDQNTSVTYITVLARSEVKIGDKLSIKGTKYSNTESLAYVESDIQEVISTGGTVTYPQAKDITDIVDSYNSEVREFIKVSGVLNGNNITIEKEGVKTSVNIVDAPESFGIAALTGHRVTVEGYFAGVAKPVIKIMATAIKDNGIAKVIYFSDDFEWLKPWADVGDDKGPAAQTVETDNLNANAPQIVKVIYKDVTALDAILEKGYELLRVTSSTPGECIYLQPNYLKFGKTGYQAGIVFPSLENVPSDAQLVLSFDWCPMRQGSGTIDPVNLIVIVANGADEKTFEIPESGFASGQKLSWIKAEVQLTGVTVTKDTKITLRQTQWPAKTANRWFLDNIVLFDARE